MEYVVTIKLSFSRLGRSRQLPFDHHSGGITDDLGILPDGLIGGTVPGRREMEGSEDGGLQIRWTCDEMLVDESTYSVAFDESDSTKNRLRDSWDLFSWYQKSSVHSCMRMCLFY
jgi:hypothetical protein